MVQRAETSARLSPRTASTLEVVQLTVPLGAFAHAGLGVLERCRTDASHQPAPVDDPVLGFHQLAEGIGVSSDHRTDPCHRALGCGVRELERGRSRCGCHQLAVASLGADEVVRGKCVVPGELACFEALYSPRVDRLIVGFPRHREQAQQTSGVYLAELGPPHRVAGIDTGPDPLGVRGPVQATPSQGASVVGLEAVVDQVDGAVGVTVVAGLGQRRGQTDDLPLLVGQVRGVHLVQAMERDGEVLVGVDGAGGDQPIAPHPIEPHGDRRVPDVSDPRQPDQRQVLATSGQHPQIGQTTAISLGTLP